MPPKIPLNPLLLLRSFKPLRSGSGCTGIFAVGRSGQCDAAGIEMAR